MKRLIIHVGFHKTGTSYLQLWLYRNRAGLLANGVLYPEYLMKFPNANHHHLAARLKEGGDFQKIARDLSELRGDHDSIIISSETISSLFHGRRLTAASFMEAASPYFDVHIVAYLRKQDEMLESAYAEIAKTQTIGDIATVMGRPMDWYSRLRFMRSIFGDSKVHARPFHRPAWLLGHIGLDLLATAGIPPLLAVQEVGRANESMSRRKTLFLSALDKSLIPNASQFIKQVQDTNAIFDDGVRWLLSPDQRHTLIERFRLSNERLCVEFFQGRWTDHFLAMPPGDEYWLPAAPVTESEREKFQAEIWARAMRAEAKLRAKEGAQEPA